MNSGNARGRYEEDEYSEEDHRSYSNSNSDYVEGSYTYGEYSPRYDANQRGYGY